MTRPAASIVISSHNRLPLFRRTLWGIAHRPPSVPFEVVVVDDGSTEDILGELRLYSSRFDWTFVDFDAKAFEAATGLTKFLNNPSATNNIGVRRSRGRFIFQQGNEVLPTAGCYDRLLGDAPSDTGRWMVMSTTYDVPPQYLDKLDHYGTNIDDQFVANLWKWPLQSAEYRSDVTNYISLSPRGLWDELGGYDERYYAGIAAEDSDFVRRARALEDFEQRVSLAVSLHQSHKGRTRYYWPPPSVITRERWEEGCALNRAIYDAWDGSPRNPQKWDWGALGVGRVTTNWGNHD